MYLPWASIYLCCFNLFCSLWHCCSYTDSLTHNLSHVSRNYVKVEGILPCSTGIILKGQVLNITRGNIHILIVFISRTNNVLNFSLPHNCQKIGPGNSIQHNTTQQLNSTANFYQYVKCIHRLLVQVAEITISFLSPWLYKSLYLICLNYLWLTLLTS